MVGYVRIPLYSDVGCTNFVRALYIMRIDPSEIPDSQSLPVPGATSYTYYTAGMSSRSSYYRYRPGTVNPQSNLSEQNAEPFENQARIESERTSAQIYGPFGSRSYFTDGFNLLAFSDGVYYLKNGSSIEVTSNETDYEDYKFIRFKTRSGSVASGLTLNPLIRIPSGQLSTGNSFAFVQRDLSYRSGELSNVTCRYAAYAALVMWTPRGNEISNFGDSGILTKVSQMQFKNLGQDSEFGYDTLLSTNLDYTDAFYKWWGSQTDFHDSIPDAEDFDTSPQEDFNNTYPGGGDDKNPYPPDGESGKGTFDNTNDIIDFPSMPTWDATNTGFISMWNPTISEISQLYSFLWDSDISTTLKKLFIEPMDAIISLAFFPVDPINFSEKRNVTIGHVDTEITMYPVQKQFVDFDFGTIKLDEYYGAAWDYSPYTKVSIYLPYIGSQELDVDDVMNADLHLQYRIDLLSGMCTAMLKCTRGRDGLDAVVYTWQGNCSMQVPVTAGSAREFINSIIQIGAMTGLALVQPAAGALAAGKTGDIAMSADIMAMKNNFVNPTMATYAALNVIGQKVHVQRGGRVDANAGVMSPQSAYIIIDRPISAIPKGWNEYAGYPSLKIRVLSTQKGMTQVAYIKLNGLEATAEEISELDGILKAGVIL